MNAKREIRIALGIRVPPLAMKEAIQISFDMLQKMRDTDFAVYMNMSRLIYENNGKNCAASNKEYAKIKHFLPKGEKYFDSLYEFLFGYMGYREDRPLERGEALETAKEALGNFL